MSTRVTIPEFKALLKDYGYPVSTVTRKIAKEVSAWYDVCIPSAIYNKKVSRGVFQLSGATAPASKLNRVFYPEPKKVVAKKTGKKSKTVKAKSEPKKVEIAVAVDNSLQTKSTGVAYSRPEGYFIPEKDPYYVKWSDLHSDLIDIMNSKQFFPVYVTGLTGNGKTLTPEQVGNEIDREVFTVSITSETSEDDLLGSFRLINGDTVWEDGPVVVALKRGAVLVLDEIDLGGERIMCLQSVLSGKGVLIKKTNEYVPMVDGFNVVATGNTKGKGDDGHGYMFTSLLNDAMLDRFSITVEHDYPPIAVETRILERAYKVVSGEKPNKGDKEYFDRLARTGSLIRENYLEGGITGFLSTRRLVDVVKSYIIFGKDRVKSFSLCTNRFDEDTSHAMLDLYKAVDEGAHDNDGQPDDLGIPQAGGNVNVDPPF